MGRDLRVPSVRGRVNVVALSSDPVFNAGSLQAAIDAALASTDQVDVVLPAGTYQIGVPASNAVGIGGTAVKLIAGSRVNIIGRATTLVPVNNQVEMFAQAGASDVTLHRLRFENPAGPLQNQVKPGSLTRFGGLAGLGNGANAVWRQYAGAGVTLDDVGAEGFNTFVHYIGDDANENVLAGDLIGRGCHVKNVAFVFLCEQPRTVALADTRLEDVIDSTNFGGSVDPGHGIYLANRPGAQPEQIQIRGWLSRGGSSSPIKLRKGDNIVVSDFTAHDAGRGIEIWNNRGGAVIDGFSIALRAAATSEGNRSGIELTDAFNVQVGRGLIKVSGADAWGMRIRQDLNAEPFQNKRLRVDGLTIVNDFSGGTGKAFILCEGQTDPLFENVLCQHPGATANTRYPIDIRGCVRPVVLDCRQVTPDGNPSDYQRIVSLDAATSDAIVRLRSSDIEGGGSIAAAVSDASTGASVRWEDQLSGAFTPTASFDTNDSTPPCTVTLAEGRYTRIGRLCFVQGVVAFNTTAYTGATTGAFRLGGLPFTAAAGGVNGGWPLAMGDCRVVTIGTTVRGQVPSVVAGTNYITFRQNASAGAGNAITIAHIPASTNGFVLAFSGVYEIA